MHTGNNGVRRGPDLKPRTRTSEVGRRRGWGQTPTYRSWAQMRSRCNNPNHPRYADWGGRGITVCDRWAKFENFLADMGEKPPGLTLERLDNNLGYGPDNCIWAPPAVQNRNKRSTKLTKAKVLEIQHLRREDTPVARIALMLDLERHTVGVVCTTLAALEDLWQ